MAEHTHHSTAHQTAQHHTTQHGLCRYGSDLALQDMLQHQAAQHSVNLNIQIWHGTDCASLYAPQLSRIFAAGALIKWWGMVNQMQPEW